jgi:hypothetical protein
MRIPSPEKSKIKKVPINGSNLPRWEITLFFIFSKLSLNDIFIIDLLGISPLTRDFPSQGSPVFLHNVLRA